MSTQHRPTFHAAVGQANAGPTGLKTYHFSSKDQAAHTKMKYRAVGQSSSSDMVHRDLAAELDRREREFVAEKNKHIAGIEEEEKAVDTKRLLITAAESTAATSEPTKTYDDADAQGSDDDFDSSSDEDDDDEDDELELQRELEQIKRDREAAAAKKAEEERAESERQATAEAIKGNPLLNGAESTARVKRQWNDDVVFRNQSRSEPELKKRFVNDTIRSDFHRSFLKKYVR